MRGDRGAEQEAPGLHAAALSAPCSRGGDLSGLSAGHLQTGPPASVPSSAAHSIPVSLSPQDSPWLGPRGLKVGTGSQPGEATDFILTSVWGIGSAAVTRPSGANAHRPETPGEPLRGGGVSAWTAGVATCGLRAAVTAAVTEAGSLPEHRGRLRRAGGRNTPA